eukprot:5630987-Pyramimonas_sp.AAC.1
MPVLVQNVALDLAPRAVVLNGYNNVSRILAVDVQGMVFQHVPGPSGRNSEVVSWRLSSGGDVLARARLRTLERESSTGALPATKTNS